MSWLDRLLGYDRHKLTKLRDETVKAKESLDQAKDELKGALNQIADQPDPIEALVTALRRGTRRDRDRKGSEHGPATPI